MTESVLHVVQMGVVPYKEALTLQYDYLSQRQRNQIGDTLLLLEHPPVITLGRTGTFKDILLPEDVLRQRGVEVVEIERGGEATYHGPGQIVGYFFINVEKVKGDIGKLVWSIEEVFVRLLSDKYDILAGRDKEHRGVWVGNEKITAVGIAVKKRITFHGFAFNVNTSMDQFGWIVPCGIRDKGVTSLKQITGCEQDIIDIRVETAEYFQTVFGYSKIIHHKEKLRIDS